MFDPGSGHIKDLKEMVEVASLCGAVGCENNNTSDAMVSG